MNTIDQKPPHLSLPLPHPENALEADVVRLGAALNAIDSHAQQQDEQAHLLEFTLQEQAGLVQSQGQAIQAHAATIAAQQQALTAHDAALTAQENTLTAQAGEIVGLTTSTNKHESALAQVKAVTDLVSSVPAPNVIIKTGSDNKFPAGVIPITGGTKIAGEAVFGLFSKAPDNKHVIANGDLILFADRPALKTSYEAGILAVADAASSSWGGFVAHKTGSIVDGLYMPNTNALFMQMVTSEAGGKNAAGLPDATGDIGWTYSGATPSGAFYKSNYEVADRQNYVVSTNGIRMSLMMSNRIYGASSTVMPESIKFLACIYVGAPA